jgi:hypothetical protein
MKKQPFKPKQHINRHQQIKKFQKACKNKKKIILTSILNSS